MSQTEPRNLRRVGTASPLVLIVEDDPDQRDMYATYLSTHGVRVKTAEDGPSAVATALESRPDIIVMDLMLPRVDGWQAIRALKADPHSACKPSIGP